MCIVLYKVYTKYFVFTVVLFVSLLYTIHVIQKERRTILGNVYGVRYPLQTPLTTSTENG
jgi:hypothetical protein